MIGLDIELIIMLTAAVVAAGSFVLFVGVLFFGEQRRAAQRLETLTMRWQRADGSGGDAPQLRRYQGESAMPLLDKIIKQFLPRPQMLRERLLRTGRPISIANYLIFSLFEF